MEKRIKEKIEDLSQYIKELENLLPEDLEEYEENYGKRAACERYFEKIIEAITDLSHLTIKEMNFPPALDDLNSFKVLAHKNIISQELSKKLQSAKGMRNVLAHQYGEINNELVFESLTQQIIQDTKEFIKQITESLK